MHYFLGMLVAAILVISPVAAQTTKDTTVAPTATVAPPVVVVQPTGGGPVTTTSTTVIEGGSFVSTLIEWLKVAFGAAIATAIVAIAMRVLTFMGVKTTDVMKAQLTAIAVNGVNDAAAKAEATAGTMAASGKFSVDVKNQILADAVHYTQKHGGEIIKSLGLDPKSGEAVAAINARIQTAIIDPLTPTNPALKPDDPQAPVVVVAAAGAKA